MVTELTARRNGHRVVGPIGIIGAGVVGGALITYLEQAGGDVRLFDPPKGHDSIEALDGVEIVFVCVPTPYTAGRGFDDSHLLDAVASLDGSRTVVIKSTVLPGTTDMLQQRLPQHRFMFSPEFLRERTAYEDFVRPDRQIVGCTPKSMSEAQRIMALLPRAPLERICSAAEAEMAKYMANAFLAVKVSYANEMYDLCERMRIDYASVRDMVAADERIGASHMDVFDAGYRGYGGKCLPKDSKALLDLARSLGLSLEVLQAADRVNAELRPDAGEKVTRLTVPARRAAATERAA
jgi:UDPglucose 6-dehydrogenase